MKICKFGRPRQGLRVRNGIQWNPDELKALQEVSLAAALVFLLLSKLISQYLQYRHHHFEVILDTPG